MLRTSMTVAKFRRAKPQALSPLFIGLIIEKNGISTTWLSVSSDERVVGQDE